MCLISAVVLLRIIQVFAQPQKDGGEVGSMQGPQTLIMIISVYTYGVLVQVFCAFMSSTVH